MGGPEEGADTWVWTADALQEVGLLARFGGQGWEAERLDRLGRFVCRHDRQTPLRWSYRRETAGGRHREQLTARLATEGWDLFGTWGPLRVLQAARGGGHGPGFPSCPRPLDLRDARGCRGRRRGPRSCSGASAPALTDGPALAAALVGLTGGGLFGAWA